VTLSVGAPTEKKAIAAPNHSGDYVNHGRRPGKCIMAKAV